MNILKLLLGKKKFDDYVYKHTEKPKEYVHVDEPKTLQDHRQVQYNNWCKRNGVYNGSYLPESPDTLTKKGKGWVEITPVNMRINKPDEKFYQRKSNKQIVRHDDENDNQFAHYHWENRSNLKDKKKGKKGNKEFYKDRYGLVVERGSDESHLAPLDKKYKKKR